ncbi:excinuclease ABC subunit UvrC [Methanobacterium alcaliphilum]|uniref:excinuclease ABC subunit UvrC n=1 Tax=Methanobacterium alcaliphilum TaxID=392018 RepID=UPI00200A1E94|nr:excinuclease ABC subunit UvrC [Methanobacterium alcaliphilum]MCK9150633.1 excinuclease ABC subunit UvrC [Methanobacterium alcaliphilum]
MSTRVNNPDDLPNKPGVYIMKDKQDNIIYVGKSISLKKRVKSYFKEYHDTPKTTVMMGQFNSLEYIITDTEKEALILEANLIKKHRPRYNIRLKDDKRYPYVKITNEDFPRILITRHISNDSAHYFGPFTDATSVRKTVRFVKSLFKIRNCKRMEGPCLNSQIDLCHAPCDNKISKAEYQKLIENIDLFFQGKYGEVMETLLSEMNEAAAEHNFERAAVTRDQINSIKEIMEHQNVAFTDNLDQDVIAGSIDKSTACIVVFSVREGKIVGKDDFLMAGFEKSSPKEILSAFIKQYYANPRYVPGEILLQDNIHDQQLVEEWLSDIKGSSVEITVPTDGVKFRLVRMVTKNADIIRNQKKQIKNALIDLKKYLKLPTIPHIIEGFDVSNISGKSAVGSMVTFHEALPKKGKYRRYNLKTPGPDDYGMMRELLNRRYKKLIDESDEIPDLILVDGGKGQLNVACEVLKELNLEKIPVMGLAKEFEYIFIPQMEEPIILPPNSESLFLLQRIRDEAHRFAVSYHRQVRSKNIDHSELDEIKGVGLQRKMNLLRHFGDLDTIKKATKDELIQVKGITKTVAQSIYNHFH